MEDPKERLVTSISTAELERRWKVAREMMKENGIDFLLMRNDEEFFGGYVRWFTDIPARHSYSFTVIFPVDDGMTTITSSPLAPADPYPKDIWEDHNAFMGEKGYPPEGRMYAHGEGYDLVERPAIRYDEPMNPINGMNR